MLVITKRGLSLGSSSGARTTSALITTRRGWGICELHTRLLHKCVRSCRYASIADEPDEFLGQRSALGLHFSPWPPPIQFRLSIQKLQHTGMSKTTVEANPDMSTCVCLSLLSQCHRHNVNIFDSQRSLTEFVR